jgi:hypothetical protein
MDCCRVRRNGDPRPRYQKTEPGAPAERRKSRSPHVKPTCGALKFASQEGAHYENNAQSARLVLTGQVARRGFSVPMRLAASRPRVEGSGVALELPSPKRRNVGPPRSPVPAGMKSSYPMLTHWANFWRASGASLRSLTTFGGRVEIFCATRSRERIACGVWRLGTRPGSEWIRGSRSSRWCRWRGGVFR